MRPKFKYLYIQRNSAETYIYRFSYTNYNLFDVNCKRFNKIYSPVFEITQVVISAVKVALRQILNTQEDTKNSYR